jgi:hypothetical protein
MLQLQMRVFLARRNTHGFPFRTKSREKQKSEKSFHGHKIPESGLLLILILIIIIITTLVYSLSLEKEKKQCAETPLKIE